MDSESVRSARRALSGDCRTTAAWLNRDCACVTVDQDALREALEAGDGALSHAEMLAARPHLFSNSVVFVSEVHLQRMATIVAALERVAAMPAYRERVFAHAPLIARHASGAAGAFLGYDFHLGQDGPRLIEINSNAGGALLNARLLRAQRACCPAVTSRLPAANDAETAFLAMFREEWRRSGHAAASRPLRTVAIVDTSPAAQYLAPEFELFRRLFAADGLTALIADPAELAFDGERLACRGEVVDLVYNRLTDFALAAEENGVLRAAYLAGAVAVTPNPQTHALFADKRNLVFLGDPVWLQQIGVDAGDCEALATAIPPTVEVGRDNAPALWETRKRWYFKPAAGFGSRATYRGEKMTRRVFDAVSQGGYVAQEVVVPSERRLWIDGKEHDFKLDLRNYVYRGSVQLVSARLYRGQTTNFRTPGGGFAAVFPVSCRSALEETT